MRNVRSSVFSNGPFFAVVRCQAASQVMRVTVPTLGTQSLRTLVPRIFVEGSWTSLEFDDETPMAFYVDHGTDKQF